VPRDAVWLLDEKRVERAWWREGLKVPKMQPQCRCLWLADGSCLHLLPQNKNHCSYDFIEDLTPMTEYEYRMLKGIGKLTHECLATRTHICSMNPTMLI
jgi:putative transposase